MCKKIFSSVENATFYVYVSSISLASNVIWDSWWQTQKLFSRVMLTLKSGLKYFFLKWQRVISRAEISFHLHWIYSCFYPPVTIVTPGLYWCKQQNDLPLVDNQLRRAFEAWALALLSLKVSEQRQHCINLVDSCWIL